MRIIGGEAGGRRLQAPSSSDIRPTTDQIREALFSILGDLDGVGLIDGFAGSGALGCEALSRGAAWCAFFDRSSRAIELVRANAHVVDPAEPSQRAIIRQCSFVRGLADLDREPDLVLLDPPYGHDREVRRALEALAQSDLITPGALIVLEQDHQDPTPHLSAPLELEDTRLYGRTRLSFIRRAPDP